VLIVIVDEQLAYDNTVFDEWRQYCNGCNDIEDANVLSIGMALPKHQNKCLIACLDSFKLVSER
jgi:hypothetical protein